MTNKIAHPIPAIAPGPRLGSLVPIRDDGTKQTNVIHVTMC